ncbi:ficolin-2-like [Amphiura filiformis]|uniref:ficolin-2-like n=1 Tax=Amphiura filiformis TaxID=82378 RepID=UPI003B21909E
MNGDGVYMLLLALVAVLCDVCWGQGRPCPSVRPNHCGGIQFTLDQEPLPKDCKDIFDNGQVKSGVYSVFPTDVGFCSPIRVYCDMEDGGGWTVFQRRIDGAEDFYRGWVAYRAGFGNLGREFWLGNDYLNRLTNQDSYELKIELTDGDDEKRYAIYEGFKVGDERYHYPLLIGEMIDGDAGDSLSEHSGQVFSTRDHESGTCASAMQGAWWFRWCGDSSLNGLHPLDGDPENQYGRGIIWGGWHGNGYSLSQTVMKFRPASEEARKMDSTKKEDMMTTENPMFTDATEELDVGSGARAGIRAPEDEMKRPEKKTKTKSGRKKSGRRARDVPHANYWHWDD